MSLLFTILVQVTSGMGQLESDDRKKGEVREKRKEER